MSREKERSRDVAVLDEAVRVMRDLLKAEGEPAIAFGAADRIVRLLERRARLLGLDDAGGPERPGESVLDRMTREIAEQGLRPKS